MIFTFLFFKTNADGQVQATGHVFAEIVEPTSMTARARNSHLVNTLTGSNDNEFILAEVRLSGQNLAIDVAIQSGSLLSGKGETLHFSAFALPQQGTSGANFHSDESLFILKGKPGDTAQLDRCSTFNGRYQVTFLYN